MIPIQSNNAYMSILRVTEHMEGGAGYLDTIILLLARVSVLSIGASSKYAL